MKPVDVIVIVAGRAVLRPSSARVPSARRVEMV